MSVLLDTCVVSEWGRPKGRPTVKTAVQRVPDEELFLSVLTIGEIEKGVSLLAPGKKQRELASWLHGLQTEFGERVLPVDHQIATVWGQMTARCQRAGITLPSVDGLLAATAVRFGLRLMTRNTRHFEATGAMIIDPWQED